MFKEAKKCGILVVGLLFVLALFSGITYYGESDTTYVTANVRINHLGDINSINTAGATLIHRDGMDVLVQGPASSLARIESMGLLVDNIRVLDGTSVFESGGERSPYPFPNHYPSVSELYSWYDDLVVEYPNLVSKINIGSSWEGRDLWVLEVTSDEDTQVDYKPGVLIDGNMHAREWSGNQVSSYLMWRLLYEYDTNETIYWLLNNRRIYVMPMQNPDGYIYDGDGVGGRGDWWRKNRNDSTPTDAVGVDLNRNWDIMWGGASSDPGNDAYQGEAPFSEYENKYLRDFILANSIDSYQNIHSYAGTLLIPLMYTSDPSPHDSWYRGTASHMTSLTSRMGDTNQHYSYGQPHEEIGYGATGGAADWTYGVLGIQSFVYELDTGGGQFYPSTDNIMTINLDVDESLVYQARVADVDLGDGTNHQFPPIPYILYGNVEDTLGDPVMGVTVTLENINTLETLYIDTDGNGYYELNYGNLVEHGYTLSHTFSVTVGTYTEEFSIGSEWGRRIDLEYFVTGDPPEIHLTRPNGGETFVAGTVEDVTWVTTPGDDPVSHVDLWYRTDPSSPWINMASGIPDTGTFSWTVHNVHSTECTVRARVSDDQGRTHEDISDGFFTIEGLAPSPPGNLVVERTGTDEAILNGVFHEDYDPWILTRVVDEGEARWDSESYHEGGSIYVNAEAEGEGNINTEDSYWQQDITPISGDMVISAAYRKNIHFAAGMGGGWATHVHNATVEISIHDTVTGWHVLLMDDDTSQGDTGWLEFSPQSYSTSGYVDLIRARMHVEAEGDTGPLGGTHSAMGELWLDEISVISSGGESAEDNLLIWDASLDDPDLVSHYNVYRSEHDTGPWGSQVTSVTADGSPSYSYIDTGKGSADETYWWYMVRAVGTNGLEEENEDVVQEPGAELASVEIHLTAGGESDGWNFVSFNIRPVDTSIFSILNDPVHGISGDYDRVMYYEASSERWYSYVPGRSELYNNMVHWNHRMGIWIRVISHCTLTVEGTVPTVTTLTLEPGWNMVGMPSSTDGNHGLPGEVSTIGYFDPTEANNIAYTLNTGTFGFSPGQAYWLYNSGDSKLYWSVEY